MLIYSKSCTPPTCTFSWISPRIACTQNWDLFVWGFFIPLKAIKNVKQDIYSIPSVDNMPPHFYSFLYNRHRQVLCSEQTPCATVCCYLRGLLFPVRFHYLFQKDYQNSLLLWQHKICQTLLAMHFIQHISIRHYSWF